MHIYIYPQAIHKAPGLCIWAKTRSCYQQKEGASAETKFKQSETNPNSRPKHWGNQTKLSPKLFVGIWICIKLFVQTALLHPSPISAHGAEFLKIGSYSFWVNIPHKRPSWAQFPPFHWRGFRRWGSCSSSIGLLGEGQQATWAMTSSRAVFWSFSWMEMPWNSSQWQMWSNEFLGNEFFKNPKNSKFQHSQASLSHPPTPVPVEAVGLFLQSAKGSHWAWTKRSPTTATAWPCWFLTKRSSFAHQFFHPVSLLPSCSFFSQLIDLQIWWS